MSVDLALDLDMAVDLGEMGVRKDLDLALDIDIEDSGLHGDGDGYDKVEIPLCVHCRYHHYRHPSPEQMTPAAGRGERLHTDFPARWTRVAVGLGTRGAGTGRGMTLLGRLGLGGAVSGDGGADTDHIPGEIKGT